MPPDESPRPKLDRVRPTRVQITYDVETMSGVSKVELPFIVGVLADLAGHPDPDAEPPPGLESPRRPFMTIHRDNFDQVMSEIRPRLALRVPNELRKDGTRIALELHFRGIEDFEPVNVVRQVDPLRTLLEQRQGLAQLMSPFASNDRLDDLLQRILHDNEQLRRSARETGHPTDDSPPSKASTRTRVGNHELDPIGQFVEGIMNRKIAVSDIGRTVDDRIAELDRLLSDQLNAILHDPEFQKLEASWRGLHHLVCWSETSEVLRIRVLSISKDELLRDMECAREFDQSGLFRQVYTAEYEVPGGTPYGVLIGDFEFGSDPRDIGLLERIAQIAAAAHAPFLAAAAPRLFGWESYRELLQVRDPAKNFAGVEYARWNAFRESENSRYVALCLPHILVRDPWGDAGRLVEKFRFEEDLAGPDDKKYLWGNAAYVLGTRITDAFAKYGWCYRIRGAEGGGLVQGLPHRISPTDNGDFEMQCSTEIAISDRRECELSQLGFLPLVHIQNRSAHAAFLSVQSCQKPKTYLEPAASARAEFSAKLNLTLTTSRFAHYLEVIGRELIGRSMSREECEERLNRWIREYVNPRGRCEFDRKYPLDEALVKVEDDSRGPGRYRAIAWLRTHEMCASHLGGSIRLVLELTRAGSTPLGSE
jgi:type VI secretion system protein ImpC